MRETAFQISFNLLQKINLFIFAQQKMSHVYAPFDHIFGKILQPNQLSQPLGKSSEVKTVIWMVLQPNFFHHSNRFVVVL